MSAISEARSRLDYHIALPDPEVIDVLADKSRFLVHCAEIGVPVSPYRVLQDRADAAAAAVELRYPIVMKPVRDRGDWLARVGKKAIQVFEQAHVLELWDRIEPDYPIMVQEWIEGGDDHLYSFNAYFASDGRALATFTAQKIRQWPPHAGVSSFGIECRNDEVLDAALRLFGSLPYRGFAYLEMKRDARTGKHYAIEANIGRPTGRSPIAEAGGVELHYTAYCDALGLPLPRERVQTYGRAKWIYLTRDAASAWYYRGRGELTIREWLRSLRGIRADAVFSWRDQDPVRPRHRARVLPDAPSRLARLTVHTFEWGWGATWRGRHGEPAFRFVPQSRQ